MSPSSCLRLQIWSQAFYFNRKKAQEFIQAVQALTDAKIDSAYPDHIEAYPFPSRTGE